MKATLEFNLDELDDQMAHLRAVKSLDAFLCLWDLDQHLRAEIKYASDDTPDEVIDAYQKIRDFLYQNMNSKGLDLDNFIR